MLFHVNAVEHVDAHEVNEQAAEQRRVAAGLEPEEQVYILRCIRATWIDDDNAAAALGAIAHHALIQNGMTPCRVRTDQQDQVGFVEILVTARHGVGAEGPHMARHR
jgi:hypothetical protein